MAQMSGQMSMKDCKLETSINGSSWTDISGFSNSIEPSGGARQTGETYTYDGDTALLAAGKREPIDLKVRVVYSEGAGDPFEVVRARYEAGSGLWLRWSPKGATVGDFQFTSPEGIITEFGLPTGEAGSGDPVPCEFTVKVPYVTKAVVT